MRRIRHGDPKTAVGYLRVSTDDQRLGPEAQRAAICAWAQREGIAVVAWHDDHGVSGGSDLETRPGLVAALGELRAARAGVLAVAKRDRLARDVAIAVTIERAVRACGARVASAEGVANGDGPADDFMRTILDAAAQYERALIRARTKAALAAKKARGERVGGIPFGFTAVAGRLVENAEEKDVIGEIRDLRVRGHSLRLVVNELSRRGFRSRAGKAFGLTQVARMARAA